MPSLGHLAIVGAVGLVVIGQGHALLPTPSLSLTQFFEPRLNGSAVTSCSGNSPAVNHCVAGTFVGRDCPDGCFPTITGTLGYSGTITALVHGFNADGTRASVWRTCTYVAGQGGNVGNVKLGGCTTDSNALRGCGFGCYELAGPFTLEGKASPPASPLSAAHRGPWTVSAVRAAN